MKIPPGSAFSDHPGDPSEYWDPRLKSMVKTIQVGQCAVTNRSDLALSTLLGSCVSACIFDPVAGVGGLKHSLLPGGVGKSQVQGFDAERYGVQAMETLINQIMEIGGNKYRLQAKLFGGADMTSISTQNSVGQNNQDFAVNFLKHEGIAIVAQDMGGVNARRLYFQPSTRKVKVLVTGASERQILTRSDARANAKMPIPRADGNVEMFND